jgi:hypothetical protein
MSSRITSPAPIPDPARGPAPDRAFRGRFDPAIGGGADQEYRRPVHPKHGRRLAARGKNLEPELHRVAPESLERESARVKSGAYSLFERVAFLDELRSGYKDYRRSK